MNSKAVYINKILLGGRNMKKKLLAITLCLAMTVSAMAGCGSKQGAINEKGLGMAGLNFVGNAVYQELSNEKKNVNDKFHY